MELEYELDSLGLSAFLMLCATKNFTRAAQGLHITQSALSQRIRRFEESMGTILILRGTPDFSLTSAGQEVLHYGRRKKALLDDLRCKLKGPSEGISLAGMLRLGAFSSVLRSVIMPSLAELFRNNKNMGVEYFCKEVFELPDMLVRGVIDLAILNYELSDPQLAKVYLFDEQNVMVEPTNYLAPEIYLDHDPHDPTTYEFFRLQGWPLQSFSRSYCDDIYGILDAVRLGMGKAVAPLHLVSSMANIRIVPGLKTMSTPVYLHTSHQYAESYFCQQIMAELKNNVGRFCVWESSFAKAAQNLCNEPGPARA
jgi:DNA-binding transcriptional LysR family regulator